LTRLPSVRPREVVAVLKRAGFIEERQNGSHLIMWNEATKRTTIIPMHGRDVPPPTLKAILKQAGIPEKKFVELL